jgi:hypothetical protein
MWRYCVISFLGLAWGQTQVDLQSQSKNVDFSAASATRPIKTGTVLPGTCATGALFYSTSAAAGSNLFGCTATNIWTLETGGGGGGGISALEQVSDFQVTKTAGNQWTINARASVSTPVNGAIGPTAFQFAGPGTATTSGASNTGSVFWCLHSTNGTIHVKHNTSTSIAGGGGIVVDTGQTSCGGDLTLWITTMTSNVPDAITESMDFRSFVNFKPSPTAGAFMAITQGAQDTIALDTTKLTNPAATVLIGTLGPVTFATLPACGSSSEGSMNPVTDSTTVTWGATVAGGGSSHVLAYCDGTNWTVAAK